LENIGGLLVSGWTFMWLPKWKNKTKWHRENHFDLIQYLIQTSDSESDMSMNAYRRASAFYYKEFDITRCHTTAIAIENIIRDFYPDTYKVYPNKYSHLKKYVYDSSFLMVSLGFDSIRKYDFPGHSFIIFKYNETFYLVQSYIGYYKMEIVPLCKKKLLEVLETFGDIAIGKDVAENWKKLTKVPLTSCENFIPKSSAEVVLHC
jgi:hypothetical protein